MVVGSTRIQFWPLDPQVAVGGFKKNPDEISAFQVSTESQSLDHHQYIDEIKPIFTDMSLIITDMSPIITDISIKLLKNQQRQACCSTH